VLDDLRVFPERMRANLEHSQGLLMAESVMMSLAPFIGRLEAHDVVHHAALRAANGAEFHDAVLNHPLVVGKLSRAELETMLEPNSYLGVTQEVIEHALREFRIGLEAKLSRAGADD
jgi:3-carboxy-cis,cis-muconate cycloisomerase